MKLNDVYRFKDDECAFNLLKCTHSLYKYLRWNVKTLGRRNNTMKTEKNIL